MKGLRITVVIAAAVAIAFGFRWVWSSSPLELAVLEVAGNRRVTKEEVARAAGLVRGQHLLSMSTDRVADRVESIPWIRAARVERIIPARVRITVAEREPVAMVVVASGAFLADVSGVVLDPLEGENPPVRVLDLPKADLAPGDRINLPQFEHALKVFYGLRPAVKELVKFVRAPSVDRITVELGDGTSIIFGAAEDLERKNFAVEKILEEAAAGQVTPAVIDVRVPLRPAVRERR